MRIFLNNLIDRLDHVVNNDDLTCLMVEIADVFDSRGCPDDISDPRRDLHIHHLLRSKVERHSDRFFDEFLDNSVLYTDFKTIDSEGFKGPSQWSDSRTSDWKLDQILWSSPTYGDKSNSWFCKMDKFGDANTHENFINLKKAALNSYFVASLEEADKLINRYSGLIPMCEALALQGYAVVDFSWRTVIEAELSALEKLRSPFSYPVGLGTSCSMWLTVPSLVHEG